MLKYEKIKVVESEGGNKKMNYEEFKKYVLEGILEFMPEEFKGFSIKDWKVQKINQELEVFSIFPPGIKMNVNLTSPIYIDDMYKEYKNGKNLVELLNDTANYIIKAFVESPYSSLNDLAFLTAKENIFFKVINTEQNKEMLKSMPHRNFLDLSIIYYWRGNSKEKGFSLINITDSFMKFLKLDEKQLYEVAVINSKRLLPTTITSMKDTIYELFKDDGLPLGCIDMLIDLYFGDVFQNSHLWVISNEKAVYGAAAILDEEALYNFAEKIGTDLYIIPSSINECLAMSVNIGDINEIAEMVLSVNLEQVELEERLSNQVYLYSKDLRTLSMATNTPYKRLDGIVS